MIQKGDTLTFGNIYDLMRNPDRRWWKFWKPRWVKSDKLSIFKVVA